MKYKLLAHATLTPEDRLKKNLEYATKCQYFSSLQQTHRYYMEEALNYILRLESELNELRTRLQKETQG